MRLSDARVHPLDRGFLFGDAVYETVKALGRRPLFLAEHLDRLEASAEAVGIALPGGRRRMVSVVERLSGLGDRPAGVYLQVSRGCGPRTKIPPEDLRPTVFAHRLAEVPSEHGRRRLRARSCPDLRWGRCDVKTTSLMATVLARLAVGGEGCDEVVFVGEDGTVREGGNTSIFVRDGDRLVTHPLGERVLAGVTRGRLISLAAEAGLRVDEAPPRLEDRSRWSEMLACGTTTGVQPLVTLDGAPIGAGEPGEWTAMLASAYAELEEREAGGPSPGVAAAPWAPGGVTPASGR